MKLAKRLVSLCMYAVFLLMHSAQAEYSVPSKMQWWYNDRFGMFIHFGSYSFYGSGEWEMFDGWWSKADYQTQISANFNPTHFNATNIVTLAKNAGMKYIVITAKHHEGFAMWDSNVAGFTDTTGTTEYNLHDYAGVNRDVLLELKDQCDAQGLKFCLYYSIIDWNHSSQFMTTGVYPYDYFTEMQDPPGSQTWEDNKAAYVADMKAQLAELITMYDPAILWFDGDWCHDYNPPTAKQWWNSQDGQDLYDYVLSLKPDIIINERIKRDLGLGDYAVAEFSIPSAPLERPWERCETMNGAWGYDTSRESNYYSTADMIRKLVTCVSRDGNYLLNIGPKGDGSVTAGSISILQGIASWMETYSNSIYGTVGSPLQVEPSWGKYTAKSGTLYAHVFDWPANGQLLTSKLTNTISRIYSMDNPAVDLAHATNASSMTITLPASSPDATDSVIAIEVNGIPMFTSAAVPETKLTWSTTAPTVDGADIANFAGVSSDASNIAGGNDEGTYIAIGRDAVGQTFTTGGNVWGYRLNAITLQHANYSTYWSLDAGWNTYNGGSFKVQIGTISGGVFTPLATETAAMDASAPANQNPGTGSSRYATITLASPVSLDANTVYGFAVHSLNNGTGGNDGPYFETNGDGTTSGNYTGGEAFGLDDGNTSNGLGTGFSSTNPVGTTVVSRTGDRVFHLDMENIPDPPLPTGLNATPGDGLVYLAWNATSNAMSYNVKRSTTSGASHTLIGTATTTYYTDTNVLNGITYYYVVSAVNGSGESGDSSEAAGTPDSGTMGPDGPGVITNSISGNMLTLSWPAGQGWRLQMQTNGLSTGLTSDWFNMTDGAVSSTNLTVNAIQPTTFFRLAYP